MNHAPPVQNFYLSFRTVCRCDRHGRVEPTKMHYHTELHFYLVLEGAETVVFPEKEEVKLRAGDAVFVNALQLHARRPADGRSARTFCLGFAPSSASWFPARCEPFRSPLANDPGMRHFALRAGAGGAKGAILRELRALARGGSAAPDGGQGSLHRILRALLELAEPRLKFDDARLRARMDRFVALQNDVLRLCGDGRWTAAKLAARQGLTTSGADALFREFAHCGFAVYLRETKLRAAVWDIGHAGLSVKQAAGKYGFSSPANFGRALKRRYDVSPMRVEEPEDGEAK